MGDVPTDDGSWYRPGPGPRSFAAIIGRTLVCSVLIVMCGWVCFYKEEKVVNG